MGGAKGVGGIGRLTAEGEKGMAVLVRGEARPINDFSDGMGENP